jgi:anti-sigma regulatory factor (Ser/Thr protein kinase)
MSVLLATWTSAEVPAELGALSAVRATLADALAGWGWDDERTACVLLATQEALVNAVEHGSERGGTIVLRFRVDEATASVRVRDRGLRGTARRAGQRLAPPVDQLHGRGCLIMAALAERCAHVASGSGTEVRLDFRRAGHIPAAA